MHTNSEPSGIGLVPMESLVPEYAANLIGVMDTIYGVLLQSTDSGDLHKSQLYNIVSGPWNLWFTETTTKTNLKNRPHHHAGSSLSSTLHQCLTLRYLVVLTASLFSDSLESHRPPDHGGAYSDFVLPSVGTTPMQISPRSPTHSRWQ